MKKFLIVILLFSSISVYTQTVNDTPVSEIDAEYVRLVGTSKLLSNKVQIELEFGQKVKFFTTGKETFIKDEKGKNIEFNSMVDALNFLGKYGYEFLTAYAININNQNVYHYLMRKKNKDIENK